MSINDTSILKKRKKGHFLPFSPFLLRIPVQVRGGREGPTACAMRQPQDGDFQLHGWAGIFWVMGQLHQFSSRNLELAGTDTLTLHITLRGPGRTGPRVQALCLPRQVSSTTAIQPQGLKPTHQNAPQTIFTSKRQLRRKLDNIYSFSKSL